MGAGQAVAAASSNPERYAAVAALGGGGTVGQSDAIAKVARTAAEVGAQHCPNGFRLLSNFGTDAMQSQTHGHIHILGGQFLGEYA